MGSWLRLTCSYHAASWQNQQNDCASSEDSDQPGHPPSLIRVFAVPQLAANDPSFLHTGSEDSDQTGQMARLTWVFAGRTCHFVGFVMRWLISCCGSSLNVMRKYFVQPLNEIWHADLKLMGILKRGFFSGNWFDEIYYDGQIHNSKQDGFTQQDEFPRSCLTRVK